MLTLTLKNKRYAFPTSWNEFTTAHGPMFARMAEQMNLFEQGVVHFEYFRTALTIAILGLRDGRISSFSEEFQENIFRLSEQLSFPYKLHQAENGVQTCELTVCLSDNLFPKIDGVKGYLFHYDPSGKVDCTITAEQYIDSLGLMQAWQTTRQTSALASLVATLYPGVKNCSPALSTAVYYNLRGILSWIKNIPSYALIFSAPENTAGKRGNPAGLASSIYALAKAGYGSIDSIKDLPLFEYLDLLLQQTIVSIKTLAASQMKPTQIAERLNLPMGEVLKYTSQP